MSGPRIVRRRLQRVPSWAQELLNLAAVYGRYLDLTALERLDSLAGWTLEQWLGVCMDAAILDVDEDAWSQDDLPHGAP